MPVERRSGHAQAAAGRCRASPAERVPRRPSWLAPVVVGRRQGNPQDLGEFFLDLDDRFGLAELGRQPLGSRVGAARSRRSRGRRGWPSARDAWGSGRPASLRRAVAARWSGATSTGPRGAAGRRAGRARSQRSASRRMRSLYSAVNRRRTGFSGTAGSGIGFPLPAAGPPGPVAAAVAGGTPVGLRPPSVPPATASSIPNILAFSILLLPPCPLL